MSRHRVPYPHPSRTPSSRLPSSGPARLPILALVLAVGLGTNVAAPASATAPGPAPAPTPGAHDGSGIATDDARVPAVDDSVAAAVHAFHDALAAGDSARALALLHSDVQVFESGHAEDLEEYRSGHLGADMEFAASTERELLAEEVSRLDGRLALYLSEYRMTGSFRGREIDGHGTETMLLVRSAEGWRIRHIHWSSR